MLLSEEGGRRGGLVINMRIGKRKRKDNRTEWHKSIFTLPALTHVPPRHLRSISVAADVDVFTCGADRVVLLSTSGLSDDNNVFDESKEHGRRCTVHGRGILLWLLQSTCSSPS